MNALPMRRRTALKAHNIKNSMGGEMSYNTIQRMLSNRRYIGELRLRDVVQPNAIPALVSEDLFNKVQDKLAKPKIKEEFIRFNRKGRFGILF